jgi:hypothetical protein
VIPLSENYQILASLFYRIEEALYFGGKIEPQGWQPTGDWMARKIGLVPESAWTPKIDLREEGVGTDLINYLNEEVAKVQDALTELKNTGGTAPAALNLTQKEKSRLLKYLRDRVGVFPSHFMVDGKLMTPHEFAASLTPANEHWANIRLTPTEARVGIQPTSAPATVSSAEVKKSLFTTFPDATSLVPRGIYQNVELKSFDPNANRLFFRSFFGSDLLIIDRPLSDLHVAIEETISDGNSVYIATPMVEKFYDATTGVLSLSAYGATVESAKLVEVGGGHAMLITGIYRDGAGKLLGYRIQNSWGPKTGDIGYYYMDTDYFDAFVDNIVATTQIPNPAPKSP